MRRLGFEKRKRLMILLIKSTHSEIQRMISFLGLNFQDKHEEDSSKCESDKHKGLESNLHPLV